jgi:hypothetical protein
MMAFRAKTLVRLAGAAAIAAGVFAAVSVANAIRIDEPPGPADATALGDVQAASRAATSRVNIAAAVDADPFAPSRQRPLEPYRLPGELVEAPAPSRTQQLKVLGTVVVTAGTSFAMCQIGSDPPVIVRVGQQIGSYTLKRVTRGKAVFSSPSGEIEIAAPQPGR